MVRLPKRMAHLERDPRGYPIPYTAFRDQSGRPHFTINEEGRRQLVIFEERCPICGTALLRERWLAGGPGSAFDKNGAYVDPPMHRDCLHYAMQVCPFLAAPNYGRRIDAKTLKEPPEKYRIFWNPTMVSERPDTFVCVATTRCRVVDGKYLRPERPYLAVEFWRHGQRVPPPSMPNRKDLIL